MSSDRMSPCGVEEAPGDIEVECAPPIKARKLARDDADDLEGRSAPKIAMSKELRTAARRVRAMLNRAASPT